MRNLSYREAATSLALIGAAALSAYQLWFVPALEQIERDRRTLEQLVVAAARRATTPVAVAAAPSDCASPLATPIDLPRQRPKARPSTRLPVLHGRSVPSLEPDCEDERDPLCGALER